MSSTPPTVAPLPPEPRPSEPGPSEPGPCTVAPLRRADWAAVRAIYRAGLAGGLAAFMTEPPGWAAWHAGHLATGRLVARAAGGTVVGWAALTRVPDT